MTPGIFWSFLFGWGGDPHWGPFHILSYLFIGGGFWILAEAWPTLYAAQRQGQLAQSGLYARVRHPQYIGFVLIMFGFLLQWPTILTLLMFPVLLFMYGRLALTEERESAPSQSEPSLSPGLTSDRCATISTVEVTTVWLNDWQAEEQAWRGLGRSFGPI